MCLKRWTRRSRHLAGLYELRMDLFGLLVLAAVDGETLGLGDLDVEELVAAVELLEGGAGLQLLAADALQLLLVALLGQARLGVPLLQSLRQDLFPFAKKKQNEQKNLFWKSIDGMEHGNTMTSSASR